MKAAKLSSVMSQRVAKRRHSFSRWMQFPAERVLVERLVPIRALKSTSSISGLTPTLSCADEATGQSAPVAQRVDQNDNFRR
jgi:hypothetical protein